MSGKQGSSPKLKRSSKSPKKGVVRKHGPKARETTPDTGLLGHLYKRACSASTTAPRELKHEQNVEENLKAVTDLLYNELGQRTVAVYKRDNWQPAVRPLLRDYIKSLVYGDGSKPEMLGSGCTTVVNSIFVELCSKRIVGDDVLPGQRQDWYQPALTEYRKARQRNSQSQQRRRPSPLDIAPKQTNKELQPTG